ncbi:MAG: SMC-Scp complex subunit ScpB [Pseudomonadota bacterium]
MTTDDMDMGEGAEAALNEDMSFSGDSSDGYDLSSAESARDALAAAALESAARMVEAILFASPEPVLETVLQERVGGDVEMSAVLDHLQQVYAPRGINLVRVDKAWAFRTAEDLSFLLQREAIELKRLSRAALEVLAITAYHQPVTRAEIEEIRGVATSKGTLDTLLEAGWLRLRGRRKTPGRPVTYGTTPEFLDHFGLEVLGDLPGLDELKGAGLLQNQVPTDFRVPLPNDGEELTEDEDPLDEQDMADFGLLSPLDRDEDAS